MLAQAQTHGYWSGTLTGVENLEDSEKGMGFLIETEDGRRLRDTYRHCKHIFYVEPNSNATRQEAVEAVHTAAGRWLTANR